MLTFIHSDRAVVRKVLGGNLAAFRILVDRYAGVVHGVAYSRLRNNVDAEDVAQETFLRLYQQLDQMAHRHQIGAWLVRVARNVSVDLLRRRQRDSVRAGSLGCAEAYVPDPVRKEMHQLLWQEVGKLQPCAQEVLVLHYFKKKKTREIAALLEIEPKTAEKRLERAREELGRRLTDLLGAEIEEVKDDARRGDRIMAAVCAAQVGWKASASAAGATTAAAVATGAAASKLAAGVVVVAAAIAVVAYLARGGGKQVILPSGRENEGATSQQNQPLVIAIARAYRWLDLLESGRVSSIAELAKHNNVDPAYIRRLLNLTLLAPDIVEQILDGKEPSGLSLAKLMKDMPVDWEEQRVMFRFAHRLRLNNYSI